MLGIEACMQFQVNSLWCLFHGSRDFCPWAFGDQHYLAISAYALPTQFITGSVLGSRDLVSCLCASGKQTLLCIEMHTRLGLKCVCSFSGQPSAAHFGHRFLVLGLDQVRTARLSRGSQITIRHPGDHTMLSYSNTYAVG